MNMLRLIVGVVLVCFVAACAKQQQDAGDADIAAFYEKAAKHAGNHEYDKALQVLKQGLAQDTLGGFSPRTAEALNLKRRAEELTGQYFDALASHDLLEKRCRGMLPEAAEAERLRSKASLFGELGEFEKAKEALNNISPKNSLDSLELARYHELAGEAEAAFNIYHELSGKSDPVLALRASTGMLRLSLKGVVQGDKASAVYANRVTERAGKIINEGSDGNARSEALALRRAAALLELLPDHVKNASYLYFKALRLARSAGDDHLAALLDFESNAVLAHKPEAYARTLDYFERNNMELARVVALLKEGGRGKIDAAKKIKLLKRGLAAYQHQVCPWPGYGIGRLLDQSSEDLTELLLDAGRYSEAFESDELYKLFELKQMFQRAPHSFDLPEEHAQLEKRTVAHARELAALLQRLMDMYVSGEGFNAHAATVEAINTRRGSLHELLAEVREVSAVQASKLAMAPVTLKTVQEHLDTKQALLKVIPGREWCTVFLVQNNDVDIVRKKTSSSRFRSRLQLFSEHLSMNLTGGKSGIATDSDRLWLTNLLVKPYVGRWRDIGRLAVMTDTPIPAHLLGSNRYLGRDFPVSLIYSANELVQQAPLQEKRLANPEFDFYRADRYLDAVKEKTLHPDHFVLLLWRSYSPAELDELRVLLALAMQNGEDPASTLHHLAQEQRDDAAQWLTVTGYGADGW